MREITTSEPKEMLQAKLTCMELELASCIDKGCKKDCDNCNYNYAQGTVREHIEALKVVIKALEELRKYRAIGTVKELERLETNQRIQMFKI